VESNLCFSREGFVWYRAPGVNAKTPGRKDGLENQNTAVRQARVMLKREAWKDHCLATRWYPPNP